MADKIVIEIDLDSSEYKKSLKKTEDETKKSSEKIGDSLDKNISGTINKSINVSVKNMGNTFKKTSESVTESVNKMTFGFNQAVTAATTLGAAGAVLTPIAKNFKAITSLATNLSTVLFKGGGLFGFISALGSTSVALLGVSKALEASNNSFLKAAGFAAKLTGILLGGLSVALTLVISKVADLAQEVGANLAKFFDEAAGLFNKTEQSLAVFGATIDAVKRSVSGSIAPFEQWEKTVQKVAETFNFTRDEVRKSAQEILLVGSKLGLAEGQMKKLIKVSAEYAKINKKDVFQTTVNFVNALNGNAQAVAALGVKLTKASVQQFAYSKGLTKSVEKMNEGEKVQLRYNKVLKQYKEIAGIGVIAANSLAESSKRVSIQQKRLQTALGEGARIIERNNIAAFAYDKILGTISGSTAKAVGVLGALGARALQVGGFVLGLSLKVYAVVKAFKVLKVLLSSELGIKAFASKIPLLNLSLNKLLSNLTKTQVEVTSLKTLMIALGKSSSKAFNSLSTVITGRGTKNLTIINAMTGAIGRLKSAFVRLLPFVVPLLIPLAKIVIVGGLIVGAFLALKKAFIEIEKRTGALTTLWEIMQSTFREAGSVLKPIAGFFTDMYESIKTLVSKGFGLLVSGLSGVIGVITSLAKRNPFGVFSEKTVAKLTFLDKKIKLFRDQISGVGFDMRKLKDEGGRDIASFANAAVVNLEAIARTVNLLRERYANFGLTQSQILQKQQQEELTALNQFIAINELKGAALAQHLLLKEQLEKDYLARITTAREDEALKQIVSFDNVAKAFRIQAMRMKTNAGELAKTMLNVVAGGFGNAFKSMGAAMASGTNGLQAFADGVKSIFGDLAGALGDYYIKTGIARLAASYGADGGAVVAAGAALKVIAGALGSSGTSGGTVGSGGGASSGSGGTQDVGTSQITEARAERPEADTNLVVNIQGDVLDGQDTGKRLVDVLGDSFGKEGLILRDVRTA